MSPRILTTAFAACLFALIATARWATFDRFGMPTPDWDQWDAEAVELFIPWLDGDNFLRHLFHPHNEHRVVLTKLQNLALGLLNGQWDARLEASVNALLVATIAVALWAFARRRLPSASHAPLFIILLLLFAPPLAWQNVIAGFHSQQAWLIGLSFVAIATLPFAPFPSSSWWLGAVSALLVLGSMGSGLLASAVILVVLAWRCWRRDTTPREVWPALALTAAIVAFGALTRLEVPWHDAMKAKTLHAFSLSALRSLAWPWRERDWLAALIWLPWILAAWRIATWPRHASTGDDTPRRADLQTGQTLVALGGWVLIQIAATAYARGADAGYPASRYMDTLAFGAVANAFALAWLRPAPSGRPVLLLTSLAWLLALGLGVRHLLLDIVRHELADAKRYHLKAEDNLRRYLATNDPAQLIPPDIPYPSTEGLIQRLAHPGLRALMPVPIRAPLPLSPALASSPFLANDASRAHPDRAPRLGLTPATAPLTFATTWGSHAADGPATRGEWRSLPISPTLRSGWLRFELAGHPGSPGVSLELRDAATDAPLALVQPSKIPGDTWRSAYVRAPSAPFVLVARDDSSRHWLAFSGPVEMGPLSHLAWQANKHAALLFACVASATLALAAALLLIRRSNPNAHVR